MKKQAKILPIQKLWLSSEETRAYLDCSYDFLQSLRDEALITFSKVKGKYFYELASIERLLLKNKIV